MICNEDVRANLNMLIANTQQLLFHSMAVENNPTSSVHFLIDDCYDIALATRNLLSIYEKLWFNEWMLLLFVIHVFHVCRLFIYILIVYFYVKWVFTSEICSVWLFTIWYPFKFAFSPFFFMILIKYHKKTKNNTHRMTVFFLSKSRVIWLIHHGKNKRQTHED